MKTAILVYRKGELYFRQFFRTRKEAVEYKQWLSQRHKDWAIKLRIFYDK